MPMINLSEREAMVLWVLAQSELPTMAEDVDNSWVDMAGVERPVDYARLLQKIAKAAVMEHEPNAMQCPVNTPGRETA